MNESSKVTRRELLRWAGWFGFINAVLYTLIGLRYLAVFGMPAGVPAKIYLVCIYLTHFVLLGMLPLMVLATLAALAMPAKRLVMPLAVLVTSVTLALFVLDTNIFAQYRFHLSALTVVIFEPLTWVLAGMVLLVALVFESVLATATWPRFSVRLRGGRPGVWIAIGLSVVWVAGQSIHIWSDATAYAPVTSFTRALPLYFPMKAKRTLTQLGLLDPAALNQRRLMRQVSMPESTDLHYPLAPIQCDASAKGQLSLLIILIDGLRPDEINNGQTPNIARFQSQSLMFENHFSGGNSSRMGIFSMFYGLPSTYWQSFYGLQREPVFMEQVREQGYNVALWSAVGFGSPSQIDRTVFAGISGLLPEEAERSLAERNSDVSRDWGAWLKRQNSARPFFAFLYYDPGIQAIDLSDAKADPVPTAVDEVTRRHLEYQQGLQFIDEQVGWALAALANAGVAERTVVLITGDHGYEFDDNGLGYIGHASNFSAAQLRTPMMLRWPGKASAVFNHRSSHHDLPATLLQEVFGCRNAPSDYSSGRNLFEQQSWDWIIAGSYTAHAIVEPGQVIVSYPGGFIEVLGPDYRPHPDAQLNAGTMREVMLEMRRFYR